MNTEHTPGPWCWDDKDALPWTDYDKTDHMPYLINANGRIVMSGDDIRIRNEADGQLMIAAPDLLDALKMARLAIGEHYAPHDCYATGPLTGDHYLDLVACPACAFIKLHDAAIAKAEGITQNQQP